MTLLVFLPFYFLLFTFCSSPVRAATFSLNPRSANVNVGDNLAVVISLDTQGKQVNGAQAVVTFSSSFLELSSVSFTNLFPSNFPGNIDNAVGKAQFGSGTNSPGAFVTGSSNWATLNFRAKAQGSAQLKFGLESAVLELQTTANLLSPASLPVGNYNVGSTQPPASQPPASQTPASPSPSSGSGGADIDSSGSSGTQTTNTPVCTETPPDAPTNLKAESGPGVGQVRLTWTRSSGTNYYNLVYGTGSKAYQYGAPNIGNTDQFLIRGLTPGRLYYFAVSAVGGCSSSGFTYEVSARAKIIPTAQAAGGLTSPLPSPSGIVPISSLLPNVVIPTPPPATESALEASPTPFPLPSPKTLAEVIQSLGWLKWLIGLLVVSIIVYLVRRRGPGGGGMPPQEGVLPPPEAAGPPPEPAQNIPTAPPGSEQFGQQNV